jgi:hypothetical protein
MAAILCLILLPVIASIGFMFGVVRGDMSTGSLFGGTVFVLLAAFLFFAAFNMSRVWDSEKDG